MPHMLAQEHQGIVEAIRFGTARTEATIAAALSNIGASKAMLSLTMAGDGVWTIGSNLTIPANVILYIPPGVTVNRATGVTLVINGQLMSWSPGWETGPGTTFRTFSGSVFAEMTRLQPYHGVNVPRDGDCYVAGPSLAAGGTGRQVIIFSNDLAARAGMRLLNSNQDDAHIWDLSITPAGGFCIRRPATAEDYVVLSNAGFGISDGTVPNAPVARLHMLVDNTLKATSLWGVPSDQRLKTVVGDFTDGLAIIQALPQAVKFRWNGKGGTLDDGTVHAGRIAQDTLPVAPGLIRTYEAKLEPDDPAPTQLYAANDSPLLEMLINAVKELAARVQALEGTLRRQAPTAEAEADESEADPAPRRRGRRA
jgi:hypothetical protein